MKMQFSPLLWLVWLSVLVELTTTSSSSSLMIDTPEPNSDDYYARLGLKQSSGISYSTTDIRVAYKKVAKIVHPDKNPDDPKAAEKFENVHEAFAVLSDNKQKSVYDRFGLEGLENTLAGKPPPLPSDVRFFDHFGLFDQHPQVEMLDLHSWKINTGSSESWLIKFYSSAFPGSAGEEVWLDVGTHLKQIVHVAAVDCNDEEGLLLCMKQGVTDVPTVWLYPAGQVNINQQALLFNGRHNFQAYIEFALIYQPSMVQDVRAGMFASGDLLPFGGQAGKHWVLGLCTKEAHEDCTSLSYTLAEAALLLGEGLGVVMAGQIACTLPENVKFCRDQFNLQAELSANSAEETAAGQEEEEKKQTWRMAVSPGISSDTGLIVYRTMDEDQTLRFPPHTDPRTVVRLVLSNMQSSESLFPTLSASKLETLLRGGTGDTTEAEADSSAPGRESAVLFLSPSLCPPLPNLKPTEPPTDSGDSALEYSATLELTVCEEALLSFLKMQQILPHPSTQHMLVDLYTFDCQAGSLAGTLCTKLQLQTSAVYEPELLLVRELALLPPHYHDALDRPDQMVFFLEEHYGSNIHEMTEQDFVEHIVNENQTWFVQFHAPWCAECRRLFPEWNETPNQPDLPVDTAGNPVRFAKVNCDHHPEICTEHHVHEFPVFLLFINGTRHQFDFDEHTKEQFISFIEHSLHPIVFEFTVETFKSMIWDPDMENIGLSPPPDKELHFTEALSTDVWIVDFFAPWCSHCHQMAPIFESAASALQGVMRFGKLNCELEQGFCGSIGVHQFPTLYKYSANPLERRTPIEELEETSYHNPTSDVILEFSMSHVSDYVLSLNSALFAKTVMMEPVPEHTSWVIFFYNDKSCPICARLEKEFDAVAAIYEDRGKMQEDAAWLRNTRAEADAKAKGYKVRKSDFDGSQVTVIFGKLNCRESGKEYTLCLGEKAKKQPALKYYSGVHGGEQFHLPMVNNGDTVANALEILSFVQQHHKRDKRDLNDPLHDALDPHTAHKKGIISSVVHKFQSFYGANKDDL